MKKRSESTQTLRAGCSNKQTNTQTDRGDYNTLRSLARRRSVMKYARATCDTYWHCNVIYYQSPAVTYAQADMCVAYIYTAR